MLKHKANNILILKNRAMGDSIMGLSSVQYLRSLYPNSKIYYGMPKWITKLYANVEIEADAVIDISLNSLGDWFKLWKKLKFLKIDLVYEMHQAGRSAKFFNIYSTLTGIPYYYHNHHLKEGTKVFDQGVIKSLIQRDLDGLYSLLTDQSAYPNFLDYQPTMNPKNHMDLEDGFVVFGVVATRETKMWPLDHYIGLARLLKKKIKIPLSTSDVDRKIKEEILKLNPSDNVEIVHIPLENLPLFMSKASLYIGNDTGLKHLAIATGIKSYTFFGPEPPNEWHPYDVNNHPYFYREGLECRTREAHYCGLSTCESMICLNQFYPSQVYEVIKRDLNE
ncbi:glycosyltransferase family 9 protein [Halobacteriovorax sp. GB3]|uniref:glycosyltransferase family 9 protein n=1 Tax=Halobacteriovorax sp. GB3 TaxID=2719615 RepID=UPI00235DED24|nr:glycosyltransferase family 9 protein [Halobacteriovorax sp. GB3]MDD0852565.1 glycosyltransferase family 9 protein [Halobacteriovorax sp. GB3]